MRIALVVVIALVLSHCRPAGPADRGEIGASIVNELPQPPEEEEQPSIKREKVEIQLDTVKNEVEELAMVEVFPEEDTPFGNVLTSGEFH
ncbi:MAG: hypothetical protein KDD15_15545, partial [Lewinella sp.]|nr:hypothetical protein [Lewinella sp.]